MLEAEDEEKKIRNRPKEMYNSKLIV